MKSRECPTNQLGEFVDGELHGDARLSVAQHLELCESCAEEAAELRSVGNFLRDESFMQTPAEALAGLAGGVVSRIRAERALSWRALVETVTFDWHWPLVGGGALTAGILSTLFVSALLQFGPKPERTDSVSSVLSRGLFPVSSTDGACPCGWQVLGSKEGSLYLWATPVEPPTLGQPPRDRREPVSFNVQLVTTTGVTAKGL